MFNPSRDEARRFFFDTWAKYRRADPLSPLERMTLELLLLHPEYHPMLDAPESVRERDFGPEGGELNPFLHLSLHLAVEEQLSIDQPPGIREQYEALVRKTGSEHDAKHDVAECLGETIWQAQRTGTTPDEHAYLDCIMRKAERGSARRGCVHRLKPVPQFVGRRDPSRRRAPPVTQCTRYEFLRVTSPCCCE